MLPDGQACAAAALGHATAVARKAMKSRRLICIPQGIRTFGMPFHITLWCDGIAGEVEFASRAVPGRPRPSRPLSEAWSIGVSFKNELPTRCGEPGYDAWNVRKRRRPCKTASGPL